MTVLLAQRERIHQFVRQAMTQQELEDLIVFLALAMIVLPLAPDEFTGPFNAVNGHQLTRFVILMMTIGALGHVFRSLLGHPGSLAWAGFLGGFVSSTATVATMGVLVKQNLISHPQAQACIWLAVSANSLSKALMAALVGGKAFAMQFLPSLFTLIAVVWLGVLAVNVLFFR